MSRSTPGQFISATDAWHTERLERLREPDGWLALVDLHWLDEGDTTVGRNNDAGLHYAGFPHDSLGVLSLQAGTVRFQPALGVDVEGLPADGVLQNDADGSPTLLRVGRCSFFIIERAGRLGVRVKDTNADLRESFSGIDRFRVDARWRINATFRAADDMIEIASIINTVSEQQLAGYATFLYAGTKYRLALLPDDEQSFFVIFADQTTGKATYGGGRFLSAELQDDGSVVLDFNRAYNPPCSFTPFATCPLPPQQNHLPFKVTAGERKWGNH